MRESYIKPKSQEKLQAQAELFAQFGIKPRFDVKEEMEKGERQREYFKNNPRDLLIFDLPEEIMPMKQYYREVEEQNTFLKYSDILSKIKDVNKLPDDIPNELKPLIKGYYPKYLEFLRKEKFLVKTFIENNIKVYNKIFKEPVQKILELKSKTENTNEIPGYLAEGTQNFAFKLNVEGKDFVARIPQPEASTRVNVMMKEIIALVRGIEVPNIAHLYAYSYPDGVSIVNFIEGKDLAKIYDQRDTIEDETIISFIETFKLMLKKGIKPDIGSLENFIYNEKEKKIYMIDYHIVEVEESVLIEKFEEFCVQFFGKEKENLIKNELLK